MIAIDFFVKLFLVSSHLLYLFVVYDNTLLKECKRFTFQFQIKSLLFYTLLLFNH